MTLKDSEINKIQEMFLNKIPEPVIAETIGCSEPTVRKYTKPPYLIIEQGADGILRYVNNQMRRVGSNQGSKNQIHIKNPDSQKDNSDVFIQQRVGNQQELVKRITQIEHRDKQREQELQNQHQKLNEISQILNEIKRKLNELDTIKPQHEALKKDFVQYNTRLQETSTKLSHIIDELKSVTQADKENNANIQKCIQDLGAFKDVYNENLHKISERFYACEESLKKVTTYGENFETFKKQVEKDLKSLSSNLKLLAVGGVITIGGLTLPLVINHLQNKSTQPPSQTQTAYINRPAIPFKYDQQRDLHFKLTDNGEIIIPINLIQEIHEINQKIMNGTFTMPNLDESSNSNLQLSSLVAYGNYASFYVPISPEGIIQSGPIRVIPYESYP